MAIERKQDRHGWIKTRLAERGYMQKDLVKLWEVTPAVVSRFIATGEPELTWERSHSLAAILDMSLDELKVRLAEGIAPRKSAKAPAPLPALPPARRPEDQGDLDTLMHELHNVAERVRQILPGMEVNVTFSCRGK
jgi:hypothetical protein